MVRMVKAFMDFYLCPRHLHSRGKFSAVGIAHANSLRCNTISSCHYTSSHNPYISQPLGMIRKRLRRIEEIDAHLDQQLHHLDNSQQQSTRRVEVEQAPLPNTQDRKQQNQESLLSEKFKNEILTSLTKLHGRIDKLEMKVDKQNTVKTPHKNYQHQRRASYQEGMIKAYSNTKLGKAYKPPNLQLSKRKNSATSGRTEQKFKTFSIHTPKSRANNKEGDYSSIKLLEQMLEQELVNLRENKEKEKVQVESNKSSKKLIQQKILKIGSIIQNEKNMESLYKNLEWQTKELVDNLNQTRSLCTYQKQKIQIYKSKLKQFKKIYGKENA